MNARQVIAFIVFLPLSAPAAMATMSYPYQSCFEVASKMHDVPVDLLLAVAATESDWDPDARSHANAHGIMQIQWPGTARHLGVRRVAELYNPCLNIELGARYLRELIDANRGDVELALASYNYGPGAISRSAELPEGAKQYAARVAQHQKRINAKNFDAIDRLVIPRGVLFESGTRAERFARSLNKRIDNADFTAIRESDGTHRVQMTVSEGGLTTNDIATLEALGWSNLGAAP